MQSGEEEMSKSVVVHFAGDNCKNSRRNNFSYHETRELFCICVVSFHIVLWCNFYSA